MLKKTLFTLIVAFALTANALQICGPIDIRGAYDMGQIKSEIPISASIDGHALTIYINENVGNELFIFSFFQPYFKFLGIDTTTQM